MLLVMLYQWISEKRTAFIEYREFGIQIPVNYSVHGIDVSKYQDVINWQSVKNMQVEDVHISFVFVKATEGLGNEDQMFSRNWKKSGTPAWFVGPIIISLPLKAERHRRKILSIQ